jgi:hypothetical protein
MNGESGTVIHFEYVPDKGLVVDNDIGPELNLKFHRAEFARLEQGRKVDKDVEKPLRSRKRYPFKVGKVFLKIPHEMDKCI